MKLLNKPSHYLALLLTLTGGLLFLQGEKVLPKEGPKKQRWLTHQERVKKLRSLAVMHKSGQNDMLPSKAGSKNGGATMASDVREEGHSPTLAQLITLAGSVIPESHYPDSDAAKNERGEESVSSRTEAYPVNLELIWMDEGSQATLGVLSSHTDEKGNFDFKDLRPGAYRLRAIPEDKGALHLAIAVDLQIPELEEQIPGEQPRFPVSSLILPLPRSMQGSIAWDDSQIENESTEGSQDKEKVRGKARMAPLEGIKVSVTEVGLFRGSAVADAKGNFKIEGVGDGPYTIRLRNPEGTDLDITEIRTEPQSKGEVPLLVMARQP